MTTIAVKDGVIAADRRSTRYDSIANSTSKIFAVPDEYGGGFVAWSGDQEDALRLARHFINKGALITLDRETNVSVIHLKKNGELRVTHHGTEWCPVDDCSAGAAWGSGHEVALGAMRAGASATRAVEIASEIDIYTGGGVDTLSINQQPDDRLHAIEHALCEFIYETTHLSPEEDDGSRWCKISKETLERGRAALKRGR